MTVTEPYCGSISFVSEGSLNGYTFTLRKNEGDISYGDIQVPMSEHIITDMRYLFSLFALDTDHLTELSVKQHGEESINVAVFSLFCEDLEFPEIHPESAQTLAVRKQKPERIYRITPSRFR